MTHQHDKPSRNWSASLMFGATTFIAVLVIPLVGVVRGFHASAWIAAALLLVVTEMAITCGYHRLFAHATFNAHPLVKVVFVLFGAMALQNSALNWSAGHRVHHRYLDDPLRDPYCARRGFWFSHIGWMLRNYPSGDPDMNYVRQLARDPIVAFEHRHYLSIAVGMNIAVPLALGLLTHDVLGMFLVAGVLRLVLTHQLTFCINSLAHMIGRRPYTASTTARDNGFIALLTFGEGYHNFHHRFADDYRNGVFWWQWDPSKWLIHTLHRFGLVTNLKRVPRFTIQRAILETRLALAKTVIDRQVEFPYKGEAQQRLADVQQRFGRLVTVWTRSRERSTRQRRQFANVRRTSRHNRLLRALERGLREQCRRMREIERELARASESTAALRSAAV